LSAVCEPFAARSALRRAALASKKFMASLARIHARMRAGASI
jgi:hypothetical protein